MGSFSFPWQLMSRISLDHPHHSLFIILALANANKDDLLTKPDSTRRNKLIKTAPKEISQLDVVTIKNSISLYSIQFCKKKYLLIYFKGCFSVEFSSRKSGKKEVFCDKNIRLCVNWWLLWTFFFTEAKQNIINISCNKCPQLLHRILWWMSLMNYSLKGPVSV